MATYGITSTGFVLKPRAQILADIQSLQVSLISASLNLQPPDPLAITSGIFADALAELWHLAFALYSGMDPDSATGDQLAGLALLTGTPRLPATSTIVLACTVTVDAAFTAAPGTMFASVTGNPAALFTNTATVTKGGAGTVAADFIAVVPGPTQVLSSTLTVIAQPLTHWTGITNATAGVTGAAVQLDPSLRQARVAELSAAGTGTAAALAGVILQKLQPANSPLTIPGIAANADPSDSVTNPFTLTASTQSVLVLFNDTEATDANGLPAHSICVVAYAPGSTTADDAALAALILATKSAGITTYGLAGIGASKTIVDSQGTSESISYTRPQTLAIDFTMTVKQASGQTVTTGQVQTAITNFANGNAATGVLPYFVPGRTVYASRIASAVFDALGIAVADIPVSQVNAGASQVVNVGHVPITNAFTITIT